jgi:manganese efflux pump family protein
MLSVLILGILVGLDNLQLASAMGLMGLKRNRRWQVTSLFALFEVSMPLVGLLIGHQINETFKELAEWLGPGVMLALGLYLVIRELLEREKEDLVNRPWVWLTLPFLMSLDNLLAGLALGTAGYPIVSTSIIVGLCAGSMCYLGLFIGSRMRQLIPRKLELISGAYLIGMAVFMIVK